MPPPSPMCTENLRAAVTELNRKQREEEEEEEEETEERMLALSTKNRALSIITTMKTTDKKVSSALQDKRHGTDWENGDMGQPCLNPPPAQKN